MHLLNSTPPSSTDYCIAWNCQMGRGRTTTGSRDEIGSPIFLSVVNIRNGDLLSIVTTLARIYS